MNSVPRSEPQRLAWLDWARGLTAVVMLQGHVFQSFLRTDLRQGGPFVISQFVGGMPPAVFLFLLGVTFAFLMDSQERKGFGAGRRWRAALKRSGYLFAAAFAFRFQLWAVSFDKSPWTDLLRVDILNCMGLALAVFSVMAVFATRDRIRLCAVLGLAVASAAPVISGLDWNGVPAVVKNYLIPDPQYFGFFPWASFVAFGMSFGSVLRILKPKELPAVMQWFAWGGVAIAFSAWTLSFVPFSLYPNSEFWLNSPALVLIKLGAVMILISFAWVWNLQSQGQWSWIRQFGMTSLLIYWVHVELVYGRLLGTLKESLTVGGTVVAFVAMAIAMLSLSLLRTNWSSLKSRGFTAEAPELRQAEGDQRPGIRSGRRDKPRPLTVFPRVVDIENLAVHYKPDARGQRPGGKQTFR